MEVTFSIDKLAAPRILRCFLPIWQPGRGSKSSEREKVTAEGWSGVIVAPDKGPPNALCVLGSRLPGSTLIAVRLRRALEKPYPPAASPYEGSHLVSFLPHFSSNPSLAFNLWLQTSDERSATPWLRFKGVVIVETGPSDGKRGIRLGRMDRKERGPSARGETVESDRRDGSA